MDQDLVLEVVRLLGKVRDLISGEQTVIAQADTPGFALRADAELLADRINQLERGLASLVITGAFSNGKSTLLNALLGRSALPTGPTPTTAVITRLIHSTAPGVAIYEVGRSAPHQVSWQSFVNEFSLSEDELDSINEQQVIDRFKDVRYVEIGLDHPLLAGGLAIIDTPGLGEHYGRARLVIEHLPRAQAVLLVLDAKQLLRREERDLLDLIGPGRLNHVFFAVNRIDEVAPGQFPDVQAWLRQTLHERFADAEGRFDEAFYRQRVFWVSALEMLHNRQIGASPNDAEQGASALGETLRRFFAGDERQQAAVHTSARLLIDVVYRARQHIATLQALYADPLDQLEQRRKRVMARLDALQRSQRHLGELIVAISGSIRYTVYTDLLSFTEELRARWSNDAQHYLDLDLLGDMNIFKASFSPAEQRRFSEALHRDLRRYLESKLQLWSRRVFDHIQSEIERLLNAFSEELQRFRTEYAAVLEALAGPAPLAGSDTASVAADAMRTLDLDPLAGHSLRAGLLRNFSPVELMGHLGVLLSVSIANTDWVNLLARITLRGLEAARFGPLQGRLVSALGVPLVEQILIQRQQAPSEVSSQISQQYRLFSDQVVQKMQALVRDSLVESLEASLFEKLRQELSGKREVIYAYLDKEFERISADVVGALGHHIEALQSELTTVIDARRDGTFIVNQANNRLTTISETLQIHLDHICELAYGRRLHWDEIEQLAARRAVLVSTPESPPVVKPLFQLPPQGHEQEHAVQSVLPEPTLVRERLAHTLAQALGLSHSADESLEEIRSLSHDLAELIGLRSVKEKVLELVNIQREEKRRRMAGLARPGEHSTLHLVFTGNPGTGKTTVAAIIGKIYRKLGLLRYGRLVETTSADLVAGFVGQTALKTRAIIEKAVDGVLFIDEAYGLIPKDHNRFSEEAVTELVAQMDRYRDRLAVVLAGYREPMQELLNTNRGLLSRIAQQNVIDFPDYNPPELMQILDIMLAERNYALSPEANTRLRAVLEGLYATRDRNPQFGNAREMRVLAESLIARRAGRVRRKHLDTAEPIQPQDIDTRYEQYVQEAVEKPASVLSYFDELVGLEPIKTLLRRWIRRLEVNRLADLSRQDGPQHMIFTGNPGTGKTTVARKMGMVLRDLGLLRQGHLVEKSAPDVAQMQAGQRIREIVQEALDGVLFLDEAYALTSGFDGLAGQQGVDELVKQIEDHAGRLVVILAGYGPEMNALLDSNPGLAGRFREPVVFPDYSIAELIAIFKSTLSQRGYTASPGAIARVENYLKAERAHAPHRFSNARAVERLFRLMDERIADRVREHLQTISDRDTRRRVATEFMPEDVPEAASFHVDVAPVRTSRVLILRPLPFERTVSNLDIRPASGAADRSR